MTRQINIAGCLVLAAIALIWEIAAQIAATPNLPSFIQVVATLFRNIDVLIVQSTITLNRTVFGLAIAIATMVPLEIMIGRIRALYDVLVPVIDLLKPLPPLAIAPVVMLFAGTGGGAKIFVIYFSCPQLPDRDQHHRGGARDASAFGIGRAFPRSQSPRHHVPDRRAGGAAPGLDRHPHGSGRGSPRRRELENNFF